MSRRVDNIIKRKDGRWEGRYIFESTPPEKLNIVQYIEPKRLSPLLTI